MKNFGSVSAPKDVATKEYVDSKAGFSDFHNWSQLPGTTYNEYPKDKNMKYISTISKTANNALIARMTEWQSVVGSITHYYTKLELFNEDGVTVGSTVTKDEYKKSDGTYVSSIV